MSFLYERFKRINKILPITHLGLLMSLKIDLSDEVMPVSESYPVTLCKDEERIYNFYLRSGREIEPAKMREWLTRGYYCLVAEKDLEIVGALWMWFGVCELTGLSGRCFSRSERIVFDPDTAYLCYGYIDPMERGKNILETLFRSSMVHCAKYEDKVRQIIFTCGADNGAVIRTANNLGARLIGIAKVINFWGIIMRKDIFLDKKERHWC